MQIVINISEDDYRKVQDGRASVSMMRKAIRNGTPLPKGHGRLIDADTLMKDYGNPDVEILLDNMDTIIEADKTERKERMKPHNCMECENSHITIQNGYCQCKVTGNCYSPIIMAHKISEDCPLYKESEE